MYERKSWYKLLPSEELNVCIENFNEFFKTMYERQEIWHKRFVAKTPQPWSTDKILANNKFTNVYRELDRVSQWGIHNIITKKQRSLASLIFKIITFRMLNECHTFDPKFSAYSVELQDYETFNAKTFYKQVSNYRLKVGNPFTDAYLKNPTNLKKPLDWDVAKSGMWRDYVYCIHIMGIVHKTIPTLMTTLNVSPEAICEVLETFPAVSGFMSYEFYLDFCYINKYNSQYKFNFTENDYVNVGPGCMTGLRLIFPSSNKNDYRQMIHWLRDLADEQLAEYGTFKYIQWNKKLKKYDVVKYGKINLHNIEMWLCEYQKYWKMKIGKGKQRGKFTPIT